MQHCSQCQDAACRLYAAAAMQNPEIRPGSRDYDVCSQLSGEDTRADQSDSATTLTCHVPHTCHVSQPSQHSGPGAQQSTEVVAKLKCEYLASSWHQPPASPSRAVFRYLSRNEEMLESGVLVSGYEPCLGYFVM